MQTRAITWARPELKAAFLAAKAREKKEREKAKRNRERRARQSSATPFDPLPHSLEPTYSFSVDTGQDWAQRFACLPDMRGGLLLVVVSKRGYRSVGQWVFNTPAAAQRWAQQQVRCNGPFDVY